MLTCKRENFFYASCPVSGQDVVDLGFGLGVPSSGEGLRILCCPMKENQLEKKMDNEMED